MSKESKPQYASIEQPFGCGPATVHCPICGTEPIQPSEDDESAQQNPCTHLAFIFIAEFNEFEYMSEDFKKRAMEKDLSKASLKNLKKLLKEIGYDNSMLALEITSGGMSCGPVSDTVVYGFDYGTIKE